MKMRSLIFVAAVMFGGAPSPGWANYICPNGATRPGERQVGMTQSGPGMAAAPVCVMDQTQGDSETGEDQPPARMGSLEKIDTYIAVALHPEANEPWAIWNNPYSEDNAKERVLAACSAAMGEGCELVAAGRNSAVALGYVGVQLAEAAWGETPSEASKNVLAKCREHGLRCKVEVVFSTRQDFDLSTDMSTTYYPTSETVKRFESCPPNFRRCADRVSSQAR